MRHPVIAPVLGILSLALLAGCTSAPPKSAASQQPVAAINITNCGQPLTLAQPPRKILSIGTSAISLLDAAGASDRIIARAGEFGSALPQNVASAPQSANTIDRGDPALEAIVASGADAVVGYGVFNTTDKDLAAAGISSITIEGECGHTGGAVRTTDFDAIFADILRLGTVFGTEKQASTNVDKLKTEVTALTTKAAKSAGTAAVLYYFAPSSKISARGGTGIANDVLKRRGFDNVFGTQNSVYFETSPEAVVTANPETIVIAYGLYGESFADAKARILAEPGLKTVSATVKDRIIGIPATHLAPDAGAILGLKALSEATMG